jgi:hypothetical protein
MFVWPANFTAPEFCDSLERMQAKKRTVKGTNQAGKIDLTAIRHVVRALHVFPKSDGWVVTASGAHQFTQQFSSKEEALHFGESAARKKGTALIIHERDGKITDVDPHGSPTDRPRARNH